MKYRVWLDKGIVGGSPIEELVEVDEGEDPDKVCAEVLDVMISNELDTGWEPVDRRAPVQGDGPHLLPASHPARRDREVHPPGSIAWSEHLAAWERYAERYGNDQSAERLAKRGGFSYLELRDLLGRDPETWEPR